MATFVIRAPTNSSIVDRGTGALIRRGVIRNVESIRITYYCKSDDTTYNFKFILDANTSWVLNHYNENLTTSAEHYANFGQGTQRFYVRGFRNGALLAENYTPQLDLVRPASGPSFFEYIASDFVAGSVFTFATAFGGTDPGSILNIPSIEFDKYWSLFLRPVSLSPSVGGGGTGEVDPRVDLLISVVSKIVDGDLYPWAIRYLRGDGTYAPPIENRLQSHEHIRCLSTPSSQ
jgi:hypothetical protein